MDENPYKSLDAGEKPKRQRKFDCGPSDRFIVIAGLASMLLAAIYIAYDVLSKSSNSPNP